MTRHLSVCRCFPSNKLPMQSGAEISQGSCTVRPPRCRPCRIDSASSYPPFVLLLRPATVQLRSKFTHLHDASSLISHRTFLSTVSLKTWNRSLWCLRHVWLDKHKKILELKWNYTIGSKWLQFKAKKRLRIPHGRGCDEGRVNTRLKDLRSDSSRMFVWSQVLVVQL